VQSDIIRTPNPKGVLSLEDKAFELLTKMYSEFSEFRRDITDKVENNSKEIRTVGNQVTKLENELKSDSFVLPPHRRP
jgi:chromosome segregation ATPase